MRKLLLASVSALTFVSAGNAAEITNLGKIKDGTTIIAISGDIEMGDDEKFSAIISKLALPLVVSLSSNGGRVAPAMGIGAIIHTNGYGTFVDAGRHCVSSCAIIWMSGIVRGLSPNAFIGFHSVSVDNNPSGSGNAILGAYLNALGLDIEVVYHITKADRDAVTWLTQADADRLHIAYKLIPDVETDPKPFGAVIAQVSSTTTSTTTIDTPVNRETQKDQQGWTYYSCHTADAENSEIDIVVGYHQYTQAVNFMSVIDVDNNGAFYDRSKQYFDVTRRSDLPYFWTGHRKVRPDDVMWGALVRDPNKVGEATYTETLNGTISTVASCTLAPAASVRAGDNIFTAARQAVR
jgi:hypothetical protein